LTKKGQYSSDNQHKLVLLVCLPCFFVTAIALHWAEVSYYLISFILIILVLICAYAVVASRQNSQYQIRTLSNLIESMIDGDYSLRGRAQTNKAFQELLDLINSLAETLSQHKLEARESRMLLERIMEQMDAMVLATNEQGNVVMANASANKLIFGGREQNTPIELASLPIGNEILEAQSGIIEFNHSQLSGEYFLFKEGFLSEGKPHQLYMLTNAERLLMEKERQAWQSLLRVLSHEMNNSLTPIATISQSMQQKLQQQDQAIDRQALLSGVGIINERADALSAFIASYSQLSHLPQPNKSSFSLNTVLTNLAPLFPGTSILFEGDERVINADKGQFEQVLINLLKNAVEAMADAKEKLVEINWQQDEKWLHIHICDNGTGIANLDNLFVPFYTTKSQGSGIGLTLCRQIMFNHNGLIKLINRSEKPGVEAVLSLPIA